MYLKLNTKGKTYMETIKLGEICKFISRGYNYTRNKNCEEKFNYYSVPQIGYSSIYDNGTFDESEEMVLIKKETADRYWVRRNDIILPPTTKDSPRAKGIDNYYLLKEGELKPLIYSQNVLFIRLEKNAPITSLELITLLNTTKMQNALLEKVYTKEKIKSISIEKLRKFEIPIPETLTDSQKEKLNRYIEVSEKFYQAGKRLEEEFWEEDF